MASERRSSADRILLDYVAAQAQRTGVPSVDFVATRGTRCAYRDCGTGRSSTIPKARFRGKVTGLDPAEHPSLFKTVCSDCNREWKPRSVLQGKITSAPPRHDGPTTGRRIVTGHRDARPPRQTMSSHPTRPAPAAPPTERVVDRAMQLGQVIEPTPPDLAPDDWAFCLSALFARVHLDAIACRYGVSWPPRKGERPPALPLIARWGQEHRPEFVWTDHRIRWGIRRAREVIEARLGESAPERRSAR